jgi:hypothetical protein
MSDFEIAVHNLMAAVGNWPLSMVLQGQSQWFFATIETLHILAMAVVLGTIAAFDLRVLGLAPAIPLRALHRLIPWGIAGFVVNAVTGAMFVLARPHQYGLNPAFQLKLALIALAGLNVVIFYAAAFRGLEATPAGAPAPLAARVTTGVSLTAWTGVLVCGALVTAGVFG